MIYYSYKLRLAFVPRLASKVASSALSQQVKRGGNLRLATIDGVALEKHFNTSDYILLIENPDLSIVLFLL